VAAIWRASASASGSNCSGGTTRLTKPQASASSADRKRPVSASSFARISPTRRISRAEPPQPGSRPTFTCVSAKRASVDAISRSQASAISTPPVMARPLMAPITGPRKRCSDATASCT
jgi:hypothetical protein